MLHSYNRFRFSFAKKVMLVFVFLGLVFLFRGTILQYLADNPNTSKYVPEFVTKALERDLADWKQEDLRARASSLSTEVQVWQQKLTTTAEMGKAKAEEVQDNLNQAREALAETKAALDKLSAAGEGLKNVVSSEE